MTKKNTTPARPRDMNQLAARIGAIATQEVSDEEPSPTVAEQRAAKGGVERAKRLTADQRAAIASAGGKASASARKRST